MNPRNRDARRLRAVRRPHSLIHTLSIRPSSKSNDDTSSFRCGSRLLFFFQSQVPREMSTSGPGTPPHPDIKVRNILPHLSTSTACLTLPAVGDGQVKSPAQLAWLCLVQAHKQQPPCLSVSSRLQEIWCLVGSYNCGARAREVPDGSCGGSPVFVPFCLRCTFCKITEKMRIQTVWLRQRAWK